MFKNILSLIAAIGIITQASAQDIDIPDAFFLQLLIEEGYDLNDDGVIQESEGLLIEDLFIKSGSNVENLEGIASFTNLNELTANTLGVVSLDLSNNKELIDLSISGEYLENLILPVSKLKNLGLSAMPVLTSLDLSGQECLGYMFLDVLGLEELDLSDVPNLNTISIYYTELTTIDLSELDSLIYFELYGSPINDLNLESQPYLEQLYLYDTSISAIDLSNQPLLEALDISNSFFENLDAVVFHPDTRLNSFHFGDSDKVGGFDQIDFTQEVFEELEQLIYEDFENTEYSFTGLNTVERVYMNGNLEIADLNHMSSLKNLSVGGVRQLMINNGSVEQLSFLGSSNTNLESICCDRNQIDEVAANVDAEDLNCSINSYCAFSDFENRSTVVGNLNIQQAGTNCPFDKTLNNRQKINIRKDNISVVHITKPSGEYKVALSSGDYTTTPVVLSDYYSASPGSTNFNVPDTVTELRYDFDLVPTGVFQDLEITIIPTEISQPGFTTQYLVEIHNKGTTCVSDEIILLYEQELTSYVSSNIGSLSQDENKLEWTLSELGPFEKKQFRFTMEHNTPMDTMPLVGGEELTFIITNNDYLEDETQDDNFFILKDLIVNSYDPNDIRCLEGSAIPESKIGGYVQYMIRFENTGTANARNVVVQDSIDLEKFDFETLEIVSSSHEVEGVLLEGGSAEFIFADIDLPFDDENNDGYVVFKIKTKDNLEVGDNIASQANIFFDFNFPIVTNLYTTDILANDMDGDGFGEDIDCDDNDASIHPLAQEIPNNEIDEDCDGIDLITDATYNPEMSEYNVYPNPTSGIINIQSENSNISVRLYDSHGRMIIDRPGTSTIDISHKESGTYLLEITDEKTGDRHFERFVMLK